MKKRVVSIILMVCYLCLCIGVTSFASADAVIMGPSTLLKPMDTSYTAVTYTLADSLGNEKSNVTWSSADGLLITSDGKVILTSSTVNGTYTISALFEGQSYTKTVNVINGYYNTFDSTANGYVSTANQTVSIPNTVKQILEDYTLEFDFNYPSSLEGYAVYLSTKGSGDWSVPILLNTNSETYKLAMSHYENGVTREAKSYITSVKYGQWSNIKVKSEYVPASDSAEAYAIYDIYSDNNLALENIRPANSVALPYTGFRNFTIRQEGFCVDNLKIYSGDVVDPDVVPYKYYGLNMTGKQEFGVPRTTEPITSQFELENIFGASVTADARWSVSPQDLGVSINNDGLLTVTNSAQNGNYTVTATVGEKSISSEISVDAVEYNLTITGDESLDRKYGFTSQDICYKAADQFGTAAQTVTWTLKDSYTGVSINENTGVVTVTADAADGDYIICALASDDENFDTNSAEFVLSVSSQKYKLVIDGNENIYISEESLPYTASYSTWLENVADAADVYNIPSEDLICSLKDSPQNASFADGEFTLSKGALAGIYTLEVSYGTYSASFELSVKNLKYEIEGMTSLTAPKSGYRAVPYKLMLNNGTIAEGVSWSCNGAEILSDGRLLVCADTPSEITINATYNGVTYTMNVDVFVGDTPSGDVYSRSISYIGTPKMSVSSGVNTKYLMAEVIDDGNVTKSLPVIWTVVRVSDGLNASAVSVKDNILTVNGKNTGTVYIVGKIAGTGVSTGEIAIELADAISTYLANTLTVSGTSGEVITISYYAPANGNYIDAVLGTQSTPATESYTIGSDGKLSVQFDLSKPGMHKIVVNNENLQSDEYIVKTNDNKLFSQSDLAQLLAYARANEYHIIYSGADKKLLDDAYLAYTALGADAKNKASELCDGYDNYFASVYMAQLMDGNFENTAVLAAALQNAGFADSWAELLLKDENRNSICTKAFASGNSIQEIIDSITEDVVLNGIRLSSKSFSKSAKAYLALCGSEKYNALTDAKKDKIAASVAGNSYASLEDLCNAIDKVKLTDETSSGSGSSSHGTVSGGGGSSSSSAGASVPSVPATNATPVGKYTDVAASHWAYSYINALSEKGIINGYANNLFQPENNISRAEFLKILTLAFNVPTFGGEPFADVKSDAWYAPYISGAKNAGLVMGDGVFFNPDSVITRQEAATMIFRFAKYAGITMPLGTTKFTDENQISEFAAEAVQSLSAFGIINGMPDGSFAPTESTTRSQAAKMIYTIMEKGGIK